MNTKSNSGMGWSLHLGRWLGTDVYLHITVLLLLAFIGLSQGIAARLLTGAYRAESRAATSRSGWLACETALGKCFGKS